LLSDFSSLTSLSSLAFSLWLNTVFFNRESYNLPWFLSPEVNPFTFLEHCLCRISPLPHCVVTYSCPLSISGSSSVASVSVPSRWREKNQTHLMQQYNLCPECHIYGTTL
jgi:hypothetical protein